jgi:CubicO group peptidase (beta-lactamase class C family)
VEAVVGRVESTAKDMARFGAALLAGQIITPANVEHIWSGTGWSYAYGFDIGSESGHRRATKSGGARGSDAFLQMYPDDGIVIVVLINREELAEADNNAQAIAGFIGAKMLANRCPAPDRARRGTAAAPCASRSSW